MRKHIHHVFCPACIHAYLLLLLCALAFAPAGCGKKRPAPSAAQPAQPGAPGSDQPLAGEVNAFMTTQLRLFTQQLGRPPTNFNELARTSLDVVPRTPPDKTWAIDYTTQEVKLVPR